MKSYIAFTKKEFCENVRTYKLFIMLAVYLLLGIMSPVTAKVLPQLLKSLMPEGMSITLSEPTALDSWAQFYKNVPQIGLIVLVILFSGTMANEFGRGTLINMLTKGLSRRVVILSKFTMAALIWTLSYALCFAVTYFYTAYYWGGDVVHDVLLSAFALWLFGVLLIAGIMLGGVLFKNHYGNLLFTGGFAAALLILNIAPALQVYNPVTLASVNMSLLAGEAAPTELLWPAIIAGAAIVALVAAAVALFNKKQI